MDPVIHRQVEFGHWDQIDTSSYLPTNWFLNGRNFPDNLAEDRVPWLPNQPYKCLARMHPGEVTLVRLVGAGRDFHPMHFHGNDFDLIAVDGRLLSSGTDNQFVSDLRWKATTVKSVPGQTADLLWGWNATELGWDIYGHSAGDPDNPGCNDIDPEDGFDDVTHEYCADHNIPFPVIIPARDDLSFGPFYSGSPWLGMGGDLAANHPGLNSSAGYFFMWHSHTEKELTSNDIWPGGLVSFMIVEHPDVIITE